MIRFNLDEKNPPEPSTTSRESGHIMGRGVVSVNHEGGNPPSVQTLYHPGIQPWQDLEAANRQDNPGFDRQSVPGHKYITLHCTSCGRQVVINLNCGDRTCPYCRKKYFGKHFQSLLGVVRGWETVRMVTLTVRNIPDENFHKGRVKWIRSCFNKLRHRKMWKLRVVGGFYFVHTTHTEKGWHLHIHLIYRGDFLPHLWLRRAWSDITGGSYIVDIRARGYPAAAETAVRYLLSDLHQKPDIREGDKDQFNSVFHGARLLQGFGEYSRCKPERKPLVCPDCGGTDWWIPEFDREYHEWQQEHAFWARGSPQDDAGWCT